MKRKRSAEKAAEPEVVPALREMGEDEVDQPEAKMVKNSCFSKF
jgi:hypothetical protein